MRAGKAENPGAASTSIESIDSRFLCTFLSRLVCGLCGELFDRKVREASAKSGKLSLYIKNMPESAAPRRDTLFYVLAALFGLFAGWVDIKVGDLLFTAMLVLAPCMLLGALRPQRPWRWVLVIGVFVPVVELVAYLIMMQKPYRAQVYESFLAFLPGIAGAYGGSILRRVIDNLLAGR
jgi:hypothetical protein